METTTLIADGIKCGGCANSVKSTVSALPGVVSVEVVVPEKRVIVTHDERVNKSTLEEALVKSGFRPV
jgi:copper chaperone CopZ